jgi:hypothetical protein
VDGSISEKNARTLTPAVLASALFVAACAIGAIAFIAARGGLQMPVAPGASAAAVASPAPSSAPSLPAPTAAVPTAQAPTATPAPIATGAPSAAPTAVPSDVPPTPSPRPTPAGSPDPLTALRACPDQPGCYQYVIQRDDSLSGVASRYRIPVRIVLALNPELDDPGTIVVGQILYLGRDPFSRLEPCPVRPNCALYVVKPGDGLSTIAFLFGITVEAILDANPDIDDASTIFSGQVIRLPRPEA